MKRITFLLLGILCCVGLRAQTKRNLLQTVATRKVVASFATADSWHPYPKPCEREAWLALPENLRKGLVVRAEERLNSSWPALTATQILEYRDNGNRSRAERIYSPKRENLLLLMLGECVENKGRFLPDIANGVWSLCEESSWSIPAHIGSKYGVGLPDVQEPVVDLLAAETSALLAWVYYFHKDKLDSISPLISERIVYEIESRVIVPCLSRNDFWWMGWTPGRTVNNWNSWICSNWLTSVLLIENNPETRVASIRKIAHVLDNFINAYPDDGGCDEGPSYWSHAGGTLLVSLHYLYLASNGQIDLFEQPIIQNIASYIANVHVDENRFVNFADASLTAAPSPSVVWLYGHYCQLPGLKNYAAYLQEMRGEEVTEHYMANKLLLNLFNWQEISRSVPQPTYHRVSWMPDTEILTVRNQAGKPDGLFWAAQGGHNNESHNHNDVGNFVVFSDGFPAIIDAGVGTYTSKTFSSERYTIWTMQSSFHNLPEINGIMQSAGRNFAARDVVFRQSADTVVFSLDIAAAWPDSAEVQSWKRQFVFVDNVLKINDLYVLGKSPDSLSLNLMCWQQPVIYSAGRIVLPLAEVHSAPDVEILFDPDVFDAACFPIELNDERLEGSWGRNIYRIILKMKQPTAEGKSEITVRQIFHE